MLNRLKVVWCKTQTKSTFKTQLECCNNPAVLSSLFTLVWHFRGIFSGLCQTCALLHKSHEFPGNVNSLTSSASIMRIKVFGCFADAAELQRASLRVSENLSFSLLRPQIISHRSAAEFRVLIGRKVLNHFFHVIIQFASVRSVGDVIVPIVTACSQGLGRRTRHMAG